MNQKTVFGEGLWGGGGGSKKIVDLKSPSVCTSLPLGSERDVGKEISVICALQVTQKCVFKCIHHIINSNDEGRGN